MANLINAGIIPMTFENESDYDGIDLLDDIVIENVTEQIKNNDIIKVLNKTKGTSFNARVNLSERQKKMLIAGGLLNYTKNLGK